MKKEEKERLEKEITDINNIILAEQIKIKNTSEYKDIEDNILEIKKDRREDDIKYQDLRNEIYKKYSIYGYRYYGVVLSDIKSSVKQGIKVGLGMKNIESIKGNIVKIVKEMISEELKNPKIETLKQKLLEANRKVGKLKDCQNKLINKKIKVFRKKGNKLYKELHFRKPESEKLKKQRKEANEKVENLPQHLPKIIKEVNKRLILDGVSG